MGTIGDHKEKNGSRSVLYAKVNLILIEHLNMKGKNYTILGANAKRTFLWSFDRQRVIKKK